MAHAREGDTVYLHGSRRARLLELAADAAPLCITVTLLDGLVLARSAFNHSMNYRTVVIHGHGRLVTGEAEQTRALSVLVERLVPGRAADARPPTAAELKATAVIAVELDEVSAKVRSGPPHDDEDDKPRPIWAGVLPVTLAAGAPEPSGDVPAEVGMPDYVSAWRPDGRARRG
jgi:nitroimidazol reductase NimA-like FMN-containing flavoprotein (pyridoxamine 5'-phosphate oxidase superfamily)